MKKKKIVIIATVGLVLLILILGRKKVSAMAGSAPLAVTDRPGATTLRAGEQEAYNEILSLLPRKDIGWVTDLAAKNMRKSDPQYHIHGEPDKAVALGVTVFQSASNPAGTYTRPGFGSEKFLWSEETLEQIHIIYTSHRARHL